MTSKLTLLCSLAAAGASSAALITGTSVLNKTNWALDPGASASQSSTASGGTANRAIDGNTSGAWNNGSVTHTAPTDTTANWTVDLGQDRAINQIVIYNRTDCCGNRLSNVSLLTSTSPAFDSTTYDSGNIAGNLGNRSYWSVNSTGRYVRIQRDGPSTGGENIISLAEVQIFGGSQFGYNNLAPNGTATQSSTLVNGANPAAAKAIDGNLNDNFNSGSTTHTAAGGGTPVFWEVSFTELTNINEIALYNRGDCCPERLSNFRVSVFDGDTEVWGENYFEGSGQAEDILSIQEDTGAFFASGDRVRVELIGGSNNAGNDILSLREVEIYGTVVPETSSAALIGLAGLALILRRKK
ncbi:discoidin domain-containing protein [Verrucomicrobiaceae bacterium N1E253]|uniref:Discoidin domain-containing protein n=2 Tax=Oceaniferula marina TaxID=2748318 RepID=A0A851GRS2_9BACT|nr:discoidin domain-containing protein [Oceaniferula marina]